MLRLLFLLPFGLALLTQLLPFPEAIKYLCDVAWLCLAVLVFMQRRPQCTGIRAATAWVILFLLYTAVVYLIQYQSVFYYLWGFRNNFRFYVMFLAAAMFLREEDAEEAYRIFDKLFWVNFAVSLIQYFFLGIDGDTLGGIFGTEHGCNGYTTVFHSIVITATVIRYLEGREKTWQCLTKCAAALCISALAELKFFFVIYIMIVVLGLLFTKFSWRQLLLILGGTLGLVVGAALLSSLFSGSMKWFTLEWFYSSATSDKGYSASGDLNRLTAIPMINELWLKNTASRIFGLGLGNCEASGFAIVNTPFYERYGDMHYTWLSYAMMYLECGWIGLVFYYGFFALIYLQVQKIEKSCSEDGKTYCRIARIMAILCAVIAVYNSSLRAEAGYMAYFVMAIPFAVNKRTPF